MNWEDERYVRLYTRDTGDWCALSWDGQALLMQLLRKADRSGVIQLGRRGRTALPLMLFHAQHAERIDQALTELIEDGCVELHGSYLVIPNFTKAQESKQSDRQRQIDSREKRLAQARSVAKDTNQSRTVTNDHDRSQSVTPAMPSVLSHSEPNQIDPSSEGSPARAHEAHGPHPKEQDHVSAHSKAPPDLASGSFDAWPGRDATRDGAGSQRAGASATESPAEPIGHHAGHRGESALSAPGTEGRGTSRAQHDRPGEGLSGLRTEVNRGGVARGPAAPSPSGGAAREPKNQPVGESGVPNPAGSHEGSRDGHAASGGQRQIADPPPYELKPEEPRKGKAQRKTTLTQEAAERIAIGLISELCAARRRVNPQNRRLDAKGNLVELVGRLREGVKVDDLRHVIAVMEARARVDPFWADHFDAVTPFRKSNIGRHLAITVEQAGKAPTNKGNIPQPARCGNNILSRLTKRQS